MKTCLLAVALAFAGLSTGLGEACEGNGAEAKCPSYFRDLPPLGAESPRALGEKLLMALHDGNKPRAVSCFELDSLESVAAAAMYAEFADISKFADVYLAIEQRFGRAGAVRERTGLAPKPDEQRKLQDEASLEKTRQEALARLEVFKDGEQAVGRLPNPLKRDTWLRLHAKNGRWYLSPPEEIGTMAAATYAAAFSGTTVKMKKIQSAFEQAKSLEEFKENLEGEFPEQPEFLEQP